MAGTGGEVQEEGQRVVDRPQVAEELDGAVGQVGAEVIALLDRSGRPHAVVVVVETGDELVGLATVESVPAVEPSAEGPGRPGGGHVRLLLGAEVPLPHGVGGIPVGPEDLGDESVLPWRATPVARESPWPDPPPAPYRCGGGCARSVGRLGSGSTVRWCGSW